MEAPDNANVEGSLQLLVAEDDPSQRQTISAIMGHEGFEVTAYATAREALEGLESGAFDIAVVDLRLPDLAEDELLRKLAPFAEDVPIVLNTGYASLESARNAVNIGAFAYVEKGPDPAELVRQVHRAVRVGLVQRADVLEKAVAERTKELKDANNALHRSQTDLAQAQRIAHMGNWEWDVQTGAAVWSDETYRIFDFEPGEVEPTYEVAKSVTHPDDVDLWANAVARAVESGDRFEVEYRAIRRDGKTIWTRNEAEIARDEDGTAIRFFGTAQDITERKLAEETLRESESRFRSAFEDSAVGIALTNTNGRYTRVNQALCSILGYSEQELLSMGTNDITLPGDPDSNSDIVVRLLSGEIDSFALEKRYLHKDGHVIWANVVVSAVRDRDGNVMYTIGQLQDITERKQGEQALRESNARFRSLAETSPVGIFEADSRGRGVYVNEAICQFTDLERGQHDGDGWTLAIHPDDRQRVGDAWQSTVAGHGRFDIEFRFLTKNGKTKWVQSQSAPLLDNSGATVGFIGTLTDLTERKRAEQERDKLVFDLQERVKELRCLYGALDSVRKRDAMADVFQDVVMAIPAAWQYPDITKVRIRFDQEEYASEGFAETEWCQSADILVHGRKRGTIDVFLSERWTEMGEGPFLDEERHLLDGLARELSKASEHKQAQERLRASEERYRRIVETANEGIWGIDAQANTQFVNPRMAEMLGYSAEEMHGKPLMSFMDDEMQAEARRKLQRREQGIAEQHEHRFRRKDGTDLWVIVSTNPVFDDQGHYAGALGMITDVTERKLLEERLRHASKMEAVGQLASGVAHEFNNLLFGILGSAELMSSAREVELPEHFKRSLQDITKCGQRGAALTRQLLSFARKKAPEVTLFDVNQVVSGVERVLRKLAGEFVTLEMALASNLPPIRADKGEIEQALMNLARNACDAMPDGGRLTIRTATEKLDEARVSTNRNAHPGQYVQLSVADTGCGMAPETVQRVFEPFFTTKPVGEGTGLGLSTVFADVTRTGGFIEVESRLGEGTAFRVYLPAAAEKDVAANENADRSAQRCPGGSETILVCDDDEVVLDSAAFLLECRGYSVIRAGGGREALEVAASHGGKIELLLTDVTMPEMNGWQLAKELTRQRPDTKVIFMSGYAADVIEAGAADGEHIQFIEKPPMDDMLFRRIREVLDAPERTAT